MVKNFHLPLPVELYQAFGLSAREEGIPATKLAKKILVEWLENRQRKKVYDEMTAFAKKFGGTGIDLDPDLEEAALESLNKLPPYEKR
jgi:hypothetical protein